MTKVKFITFLLLSVFISSCASDSDTDSDKEKQTLEYTINYNGASLLFPDLKAVRDGDYFSIGETIDMPQTPRPDQTASDFSLYFHADGTLLKAAIRDKSLGDYIYSPFYFSKNLFKFNLEKIDETDKKIKVSFSGNLYEHYWDQIYQYNKKINGSIWISYTEQGAVNSHRTNGTTMKINGQNWRGLGYQSPNYSSRVRLLKINGDTEYGVGIVFPNSIPKKGKYTFKNSSEMETEYTVTFYKYSPNTIGPDDYSRGPVQYITTGVLEITDITAAGIIGTFSFTAVNPDTKETVTVKDGIFTEELL